MEQIIEATLVFTLFGSVLLFWLSVITLFIFFVWADIVENGWIAFWVFVIFLMLHMYSNNKFMLEYVTVKNLSIYLCLGFIFSLIRTYFKGRELKQKDLNSSNDRIKTTFKQDFKLKEHVFRWWFLFPISLTNWIFTDLIKNLYDFIYHKVERIYLSIFNA